MALPGYPVYDSYGPALIRTIGSFWYHYFADRDRLELLFRGDGHLQGQAYIDFLEAVASVSRFDVPVFHEEEWFLLVLKDSDRNRVTNVYDREGLAYDAGEAYDAPQTGEILFPLPTGTGFFEELVDAPFNIYNRVLYPSKSWSRGTDFDIDYDRKVLRFYSDPFESEYVARRDVYDDSGNLVDEEIGLWVYRGQFDLEHVWSHFGFAVNLQLKSSRFYKDIVNALWDGHVFGANMESFSQVIAAAVGMPLVLEPTETVEVVRDEGDRLLIITDKNVYSFSPNATPVVSVGDTVTAGETLVDAIKVVDISGSTPDYDEFQALSFNRDFLSGGYFSELVFENALVDVEYLGADRDGKVIVTFRVQGFPGDVDIFFEQVHEAGKAAGHTLAELLDLRTNPVGEPLPEHLPAQINPLEFILTNTMRNHLVLVKIKTSAIVPDSPGLGVLNHLRELVPPHTSFVVFVEMAPDADTIDLSQAGDDAVPGAVESTDRFGGAIPAPESVYVESEAPAGEATYGDAVLRVYRVSEVCR